MTDQFEEWLIGQVDGYTKESQFGFNSARLESFERALREYREFVKEQKKPKIKLFTCSDCGEATPNLGLQCDKCRDVNIEESEQI